MKVSRQQARLFLSLWTKKGWLRRIRQGLYVPVDLKATTPEEAHVDPWVVAEELFSPCYIGGWSAAQYWDFTEQIFESTVVLTTRRFSKGELSIGEMQFFIKKISPNKMFGLKTIWKDQVRVQLSDPHRTIVDILDNPALGGGIRCLIDFIQSYMLSRDFNETLLIKYANQMKNKTIFKRLGYILSMLHSDKVSLIEFCEQNLSLGNSQIDPLSKGKCLVKKWRLWVPKGVFGRKHD